MFVALRGASEDGVRRAALSMARQGFIEGPRHTWRDGDLFTWQHPSQLGTENCTVELPSGAAFGMGPMWYRGRSGSHAAALLLKEAERNDTVDEMQLRGNFVLFLRTRDRCLLLNDAFGFVRIYVSSDAAFYSSSWLAVCAYAGSPDVDERAAAEYVLLGASHSNKTVAAGITTLPLAHAFDLTRRHSRPRLPAGFWNQDEAPASFERAVDRICDHLRTVHEEVSIAFPGRTRAALSGGFDSRLIVAGLVAAGSRPELFVYGNAQSDDVRIAKAVAGSANLSLKIIDKSIANRRTSPPDLERLVQSSLFFDGLPNDGVYDAGADQATRLEQTAGGCIALNGGGGEIFRNFFHLPDRPMHAVDIVRAFYRGFDPGVFRRRNGLAFWEEHLASSIEHVVATPGVRTLDRRQVELAYPLFRCHYWMAVNNSVATRHGFYATPLVDLNAVKLACGLPLAWKNAGRLESRLVTLLHSGLANQPSSYGFRFSSGPNRHARFTEWATCMRPVFTRPFINAVRRRLGKQHASTAMVAHCRSLLPGEWRLDALLDLDRLPDNAAFARALAVEIAWRESIC